jgi:TetR/AcrR family transcriptional regulator
MDGATAPTARREREKRDPEATRRALLQAGAALFSERGFDGVSIEDLADHAGVNKALISYHFRGKRHLYVAILESAFATMADRLKAIEAAAPDAREGLRAFLAAFEQMTRERPGFPTLFLREVLSTGIEPALLPHLVEIVGVSRRLGERGAREGLFRKVDPVLLHLGLVGALVFFFATESARRKAAAEGRAPFAMPAPKAFLRYLEELTLRGLAPDPLSRRAPALAPANRPRRAPRLAPEGRPRSARRKGARA